jgi:hypothetical protein
MRQEPPGLERADEQEAGKEACGDPPARPLGRHRNHTRVVRQRKQRRLADCDMHLRTIRYH